MGRTEVSKYMGFTRCVLDSKPGDLIYKFGTNCFNFSQSHEWNTDRGQGLRVVVPG